MQIGVIGARGNIGQRIVAEALSRGHKVVAFTRPTSPLPHDTATTTWRAIDILASDSVAASFNGLDVVISSYQPGNAALDFEDMVRRSVANPTTHLKAAETLLEAMVCHPTLRVLVVGGAGSLEIAPGVAAIDLPEAQVNEGLAMIGLPAAYAAVARGHRDALHALRQSNRLWTYVSPPLLIEAGDRTGIFRVGGDQLLVDAQGVSRISYEDFAVALLDEVELPKHVQGRFTVAY